MFKARNLTLGLLLGGLAAALAAWFAYEQAKESYSAVGFNNGEISARFELAEKIRNSYISELNCGELKATGQSPQQFFSVKDRSIYLSRDKSGLLRFCEF